MSFHVNCAYCKECDWSGPYNFFHSSDCPDCRSDSSIKECDGCKECNY